MRCLREILLVWQSPGVRSMAPAPLLYCPIHVKCPLPQLAVVGSQSAVVKEQFSAKKTLCHRWCCDTLLGTKREVRNLLRGEIFDTSPHRNSPSWHYLTQFDTLGMLLNIMVGGFRSPRQWTSCSQLNTTITGYLSVLQSVLVLCERILAWIVYNNREIRASRVRSGIRFRSIQCVHSSILLVNYPSYLCMCVCVWPSCHFLSTGHKLLLCQTMTYLDSCRFAVEIHAWPTSQVWLNEHCFIQHVSDDYDIPYCDIRVCSHVDRSLLFQFFCAHL